ncbi:unnamed protein product, partial [Iphiclides podalirius]
MTVDLKCLVAIRIELLIIFLEAELSTWTSFLQRAVDATYNTEVVIDNLHNMITEQRRCVREVSASNVFTSLCGEAVEAAEAAEAAEAGEALEVGEAREASEAAEAREAGGTPRTPLERRAPSAVSSTPIARD